ncbi:class I SAM-dependent DNA methyltransferase [Flavobacterium xueshanense]|uniref:site-specific DNA-methyltransferase (adenine-specific) n=1 Tax=Flavobacterium xueshanense TaxID=935223 RepID=A0A1I2GZP2_9FLAO|nr:DNA methyltransferase [Flavobacterium xueshanense]SFF22882.1 Type II restriction/modification system, DNA methylase subunit YeeA [Flavobacterium xueshanense]
MNIAQIEENLQNLILNYTQETFIYELLIAYGLPKASITRLQKGNLNLSKVECEISWKKKLFFKPVFNEDLRIAITNCKDQLKQEQRFIIVTDFKTVLAIDTKTTDTLDIEFEALPKHFDFFLPWAGMEKATHQNENPADVKAAGKMVKLFDEIKKDNPDTSPEFIHGLNVFLSRLLFCFFAEDTGIYKLGQFTNAIASHTQTDGNDLNEYLNKLFDVLNTPENKRKDLPQYLSAFPYVNGGLFQHNHPTPTFTRRSRQAIIDAGELDWAAINPDIFGSMFQAVILPEHRGGLGAHYTSVPNIMKVIEPLFLNDLYEEFENGKNEPKKLNKLLDRVSKLKIFDPACGSGNFLIIAYKELRLLEIKILEQLQTLQKAATGFEPYQLELIPKAQLTLAAQYQHSMFSRIELAQFYGIEIDDFAHEIAILSLWLAQHQMNQKFKEVFGVANPTLPLQAGGNIVHGNATRVDWEEVCPKKDGDEIYILGNPPYLGFSFQNKNQKDDMIAVFKGLDNFKFLDYISCWFLKASDYFVNINGQFAFVSTNSICQGNQVDMLWSHILEKDIEISFAYPDFKWDNNAKAKAQVICSIIGLRNKNNKPKYLFKDLIKQNVDNINPYLVNGSNIIIKKRNKNLSGLPNMEYGNMPLDGGYLLLNENEKDKIISDYPNSSKYFKLIVGSKEFINNQVRWCLWLNNNDLESVRIIEPIYQRIENVRIMRENGGIIAKNYQDIPHRFYSVNVALNNQIIIPRVSSERRKYVPIGFLDCNTIISDSAQAIYDPEPYIFSILNSTIHMVWFKATAGRLKTDYRYSSALSYNTFPFPKISGAQKQELEQCVFRILEERENHSEKTLAQLYDPDKMPEGLREGHRLNDLAVERCYRSKPFDSDEERLEYLFKLYEKMIAEEKEKDTLFQEEKKAKKTNL